MIRLDENHIYWLGDEKRISVSAWIKTFTPPFDKEARSQSQAEKDSVSQEYILQKWEKKKNISLYLGNWVHESIEYYLKYDKNFSNQPVEAFKKHQTNNEYLSETIVYDDTYAGTIDLIERVNDKQVILHDFKTNEDLYKGFKNLIRDFAHLENNPINKYTLQLSKYKELYEKFTGEEVIGLNIWHYKDGEFTIIPIEPIDLYPKKQTLKSFDMTRG